VNVGEDESMSMLILPLWILAAPLALALVDLSNTRLRPDERAARSLNQSRASLQRSARHETERRTRAHRPVA